MTLTRSERAGFIRAMTARVMAGTASYGCTVGSGVDDLTDEVRDAVDALCERTGREPQTRAVVRDFAWEPCAPGTDGRTATGRRFDFDLDEDEDEVAGTLTGYVLRWSTSTPTSADRDGTPGPRVSYTPGAFDEYLQDRTQAVDVQRDHLGDPIGQWLWLEADDYGLLGHAAIFDTAEGRRALEDARSGELRALSFRALQHDRDSTRAVDSHGEYFVVYRAMLAEAGPVGRPADPGARIVAVDGEPVDARGELDDMGLEDLLGEIAALTGRSTESILRDERIEQSARKREVDEAVGNIERALSAHRKAWAKHRDAVRARALGSSYAPSFDEIRDLADEVDEPAEYLRTRLDGDLYREMVAPKTDLGAALLAGVTERSRRRY